MTDIYFTSCSTTFRSNLCGNFVGLFCSWDGPGSYNPPDYLNGCGPIYDGAAFAFLPFANVVYTVAEPALTTAAYDTNVANCSTSTFTVAYKSSTNVSITKPAWLTWDSTLRNFVINTANLADIGMIKVVVTATNNHLLFTTSFVYASPATLEFTIEIKHPCRGTTINTRTLSSMAVLVSQSTTQDIWFTDTVAINRSDSTFCGTRSFSISPSHSFLSISGSTLTLATNSVTDAGTYNVNITVGLTSYSEVV